MSRHRAVSLCNSWVFYNQHFFLWWPSDIMEELNSERVVMWASHVLLGLERRWFSEREARRWVSLQAKNLLESRTKSWDELIHLEQTSDKVL